MGFSGFFHLHTYEMATGKSAISRALQSKKPKKYPNPPTSSRSIPRLHTNGPLHCMPPLLNYIWTKREGALNPATELPKHRRPAGLAPHVGRARKCCAPCAGRQATNKRIMPDKKQVIGRNASTGVP